MPPEKEPLREFTTEQLTLDDEEKQSLADQAKAEEAVDPIAQKRMEIYEKADVVRAEEEAEARGEEIEEDEPEAPAADDDEPEEPKAKVREPEPERTILLNIGGRTQPVRVADAQALAQRALDAEVQRAATPAKKAEPAPEPVEIDYAKLGEQLQLGDENERREALTALRDSIRDEIKRELTPNRPVPTQEDVDRQIDHRLEQRTTLMADQRDLNEATSAAEEAYPALKTERTFQRLALEETFRERTEDLVAYAKAGGTEFTEEEARNTLRRAEQGDYEAARVIAANHRALQLRGEQGFRTRKEVFTAAAAKIADTNPNWKKGSMAKATDRTATAAETKRKLTTQPRAAHRQAPATARRRQADAPTEEAEQQKRRDYVAELQQLRGGYAH